MAGDFFLLQYQNLVIPPSPVDDRQIPMRNQRGFSLIEALITMVLLIVGLLVARRIKANANAAGRTSGVAVARSVMDDLTICAAVQWMTPC
jgi:hypothetical protein